MGRSVHCFPLGLESELALGILTFTFSGSTQPGSHGRAGGVGVAGMHSRPPR